MTEDLLELELENLVRFSLFRDESFGSLAKDAGKFGKMRRLRKQVFKKQSEILMIYIRETLSFLFVFVY